MLRDSFPAGLLLAQSIYCAKTALAFYNSKHGTEFKLVEPLASARILSCKILFHCNFTAAKLKMDGSRTARPKLFFASFVSFKKKISRMICHIIDPAKAFYMCCEECPPEMALDIFNKKHGTIYKLVKSLKCNIVPISFGVYKFHCNFKAKVADPAGSCVNAAAASSKRCILDATEGLHDHCSICREGILHPVDYRSP